MPATAAFAGDAASLCCGSWSTAVPAAPALGEKRPQRAEERRGGSRTPRPMAPPPKKRRQPVGSSSTAPRREEEPMEVDPPREEEEQPMDIDPPREEAEPMDVDPPQAGLLGHKSSVGGLPPAPWCPKRRRTAGGSPRAPKQAPGHKRRRPRSRH
ncbi:uncharacterized protein [Patagioenas fasciata]|uniref:uncharacterized protein isoform X6 n=1 Tax=Patagioenas fasciata TaxID=372321 RepID=UPI003A99BFFD